MTSIPFIIRFRCGIFTALVILLLFPGRGVSQVFYTDINPDTILSTTGDFYEIDANRDGWPDFRIQLSIYTNEPFSIIRLIPLANYCYAACWFVEGCPMTERFQYNDSINSAYHWCDYSYDTYIVMNTVSFCLHSGDYMGKTNAYAGLRFGPPGNVMDGWLRVDVDTNGFWIRLKDYAFSYNGIRAGETGVGIGTLTSSPSLRVCDKGSEIVVETTSGETIRSAMLVSVCGRSIPIPAEGTRLRLNKESYSPGLYVLLIRTATGTHCVRVMVA